MSDSSTRDGVLRHVLMGAVLLQGLSGIGGGLGLLADPTGDLLGIPLAWLDGSPFDDYALPGSILLWVLGVFPVVVAWGLWRCRRWARYGSLAVGGGLLVWILVEVRVVGHQADPPLQVIYGMLGVLITGLALAWPGPATPTARVDQGSR